MGALATALRPPELRVLTEKAWETGRVLGWAEPTAAGRSVTVPESLQLIDVFACMSLIAETIGTLPLGLQRQLEPRGYQSQPRHPMYPILHDHPNPEMTAVEVWETVAGHVGLRGNAFLSKEPLKNGAYSLWPLRPDRMVVERDPVTGGLRYRYYLPSGEQRALVADELVHIRGWGSDGYVGYSRVGLAREALGRMLAIEEYGARFFGNASRPSGVLQVPGELSPNAAKQLKADWEQLHRGLENAHRIAVLEQGTTWQQIGLAPEESQFLESQKFSTNQTARLFRVPPHMIGDVERTTSWGTGIEQMGIGFVIYTLQPYLTRIQQRLKVDTLHEPDLNAIFDPNRLLRGSFKDRVEALQILRRWGCFSANDVRADLGYNPSAAGGADDLHILLNMTPMDLLRDLPMPEALPGYRAAFREEARMNGHDGEDLEELMASLGQGGNDGE